MKIQVLEKIYTIEKYSSEVFDFKENEMGRFIEQEDCIVINLAQTEVNQTITMLHELAHAYFCQIGDTEYLEDEKLCDKIALFIYSLIGNNKIETIKEKQ